MLFRSTGRYALGGWEIHELVDIIEVVAERSIIALLSDIVHVDVAGLEEDGGYNGAALSVSLRV